MHTTLYRISSLFFTAIILLLAGCSTVPRDTAHQHSTIDALLAGVYDGSLTLKELSEHGDFGIGTFDRLDGEMLMVGNRIYQIKSDGKIYTPPLSLTTPFATVCQFDPELSFSIEPGSNFEVINAHCEIDMLNRYTLTLPTDVKGFAETDLTVDRSKELKAVEQ